MSHRVPSGFKRTLQHIEYLRDTGKLSELAGLNCSIFHTEYILG